MVPFHFPRLAFPLPTRLHTSLLFFNMFSKNAFPRSNAEIRNSETPELLT